MADPATTESEPETPSSSGDLAGIEHVDFIGIGGCGMSGLARMLHAMGITCSGSDSNPSSTTSSLAKEGLSIRTVQDGTGLPSKADLIVASAAIAPDHPEIAAAEERGLRVRSYAEVLGMVQADRTSICIAGTHGKSTTGAMLCHVLMECGLDPGFIIGANCGQIGPSRPGAALIPGPGPMEGEPGLVVCEACEFDRSFHHHRPTIALINNLEEDHLDIYGSIEAIVDAFREFAQLLPPAEEGGSLLIAHDGAHRHQITPPLHCRVATFGYHPEADYQVVWDQGVQRVGILRDGLWVVQWTNMMPGAHNALNAAAAVILAHQLGAEWEDAAQAMNIFQGLERRMQRLGDIDLPGGGQATLYDDYGHHPTEIEHTLHALRSSEDPGRLICVFQPHQHSRTRFMLESFAESFSSADEVIIPHIYFVRDSQSEKQRVSAVDLVERLQERGVVARHIDAFEDILSHLELNLQDDDLLVIMGAGPVWTIGRDLLERLTP